MIGRASNNVKWIVLLFFLSLIACSGSKQLSNNLKPEDYVWPLPPEPPKIQFIKSVHSEMDVGRKRSLAKRIYEAIFGRSPLRALRKPLAVHSDQFERVLVVDTGWRKVLVFDFSNNRVDMIGRSGRGRLMNPLGVTTDDKNRIYVTDAGGCRVMVYDSNGQFLNAFGGKDVLVRPSSIAVNSDKVYVVDTWAHQLKIFDKESGQLLSTIGKSGEQSASKDVTIEGALDQTWNRGKADAEFRFPTQIAIGPDGRIYIIDTLNFRVQIFTADGEFIKAFGTVGNLPGNFYRPKGIALDSEGHIYVADAAFNNIQIFDQNGKLLLYFGSFGSGLADLRLPAGMFINDNDKVFVVDQFNNRIQVYQYLSVYTKK